jgi:hypothetical protein
LPESQGSKGEWFVGAQNVEKTTDNRDQQDLFADGGNDALGDVFGLQLKGGDEEDADFDDDDDEDEEEEGEV